MVQYTSVDQIKAALGLSSFDVVDDAWLTEVAAAVNIFVNKARPDQAEVDPPDGDMVLGSTMLGTRWYTRRNATEVAALNEFGTAPPSIDRDIETMLGIGRAHRPVVA